MYCMNDSFQQSSMTCIWNTGLACIAYLICVLKFSKMKKWTDAYRIQKFHLECNLMQKSNMLSEIYVQWSCTIDPYVSHLWVIKVITDLLELAPHFINSKVKLTGTVFNRHFQGSGIKPAAPPTPATYSPLSSWKVLECSSSRLQSVLILAQSEKGEVESHHLRLIEKIQTCTTDDRDSASDWSENVFYIVRLWLNVYI